MSRAPNCHCHCLECACPEEPVVLHEWTGGAVVSLDFNQYSAWRKVRKLRNVQWTWELYCAGGTETCGGAPIQVPPAGKPSGIGLIREDFGIRIRTVIEEEFTPACAPPPHNSFLENGPWYQDNCPGSADTITTEGANYSGIIWQLRARCWCCSATRASVAGYYDELISQSIHLEVRNRPGLWDDMHRDFLMCVPGDVDHLTRAKCAPEVVYMNGRAATGEEFSRLKTIYGDAITYWGLWLNGDFSYNFDRLDFSRVKVLILGHQIPTYTVGGGGNVHDLRAEPITGDISKLTDWLSLGDKILILDGGVYSPQFLSDLGLTTTWELSDVVADHNTFVLLSATLPSLVYAVVDLSGVANCPESGGGEGFLSWPHWRTDHLTVEPQSHQATNGISENLLTIVDDEGVGMCGRIGFGTQYAVTTPGTGATVLGRVIGDMYPVCVQADCVSFVPVDYPVTVIEPWSGQPRSRIVCGGHYAPLSLRAAPALFTNLLGMAR